jgi:hypothetical protein
MLSACSHRTRLLHVRYFLSSLLWYELSEGDGFCFYIAVVNHVESRRRAAGFGWSAVHMGEIVDLLIPRIVQEDIRLETDDLCALS